MMMMMMMKFFFVILICFNNITGTKKKNQVSVEFANRAGRKMTLVEPAKAKVGFRFVVVDEMLEVLFSLFFDVNREEML